MVKEITEKDIEQVIQEPYDRLFNKPQSRVGGLLDRFLTTGGTNAGETGKMRKEGQGPEQGETEK